MPHDDFSSLTDSPISPARRAFAVTPSDSTPLARLPKALYVGGAGNVTLRAVDSVADVTIAVQAGQVLPLRASHVRAAGTTATGLVALA
jgi:hypothetical protein